MAEHAPHVEVAALLAAPAGEHLVIADVDELDKENLGWTKNYVTSLTERVAREQAADQPDFVMIGYLKREVATYQELLDRVAPQKI